MDNYNYNYKDINKERKSGIIKHISSLWSEYGIGNLGEEAYKFADFLKESGQCYWQILPIGPTGYGDSPYQSFSSFAGNPYFIENKIPSERIHEFLEFSIIEKPEIKKHMKTGNQTQVMMILDEMFTIYHKRLKINNIYKEKWIK